MLIIMRAGASEEEVQHVVDTIKEAGLRPHISRGVERTIIGAIGDEAVIRSIPFEAFSGVESAAPIVKPYKVVGRELHPDNTIIQMGGITIGGKELVIAAGPCSVEPGEVIFQIASAVKAAGGHLLRGGAFKPRTSPYDFQGMGEAGLKLLAEARERTGLQIVTEVMDTRDVELVCRYADMLQIGARNMQNFNLLKEVGKTDKAVLLKRGMSSTIKEWLMAAEYVYAQGNPNVILCERGIRTFETMLRNTFDAGAVAVAKMESHLPVFVDPSHAAGHAKYVLPIALAGVAVGADGLIVEVHVDPEHAMSDGAQTLRPARFQRMIEEVKAIAEAVGRSVAPPLGANSNNN